MSHSPPRRSRSAYAAAALLLVLPLASACEASIPVVPLDPSIHNACADSLSYDNVDASASEIQCFIEDYITRSYPGVMAPGMPADIMTNQPGDPICCEVCATKGTADQACDAMCKPAGL